MGLLKSALATLAVGQACAAGHIRDMRSRGLIKEDILKRNQDIVKWDNYSLSIDGERLMVYSGEFHPFRLPVPSLWIDVFQKMKALGLNTASFYVMWALLEGKPGKFRAEGIFDLSKFFSAAKEAGMYLTARPGPYINAEVSCGGYPGWMQRIKGHLRTTDADYLRATDNYMANISRIIADAQITEGGPVILFQPENEYSQWKSGFSENPAYMQYVEDQAHNAGIVVPMMSNDAHAAGHNVPGSGLGEVEIYGHDGYPLGFQCANPTFWPGGNLPNKLRATHMKQSPTTPYSIPEFQAGSFDAWGGAGFAKCEQLVNQEQARVFYKNNYAAGVTIMNLYMLFGGTNWGNLGHDGGYTSYDYGAPIAEDRSITREKYSEVKLQAQFLKASPGYLVATPAQNFTTGVYSNNTAMAVTPLFGPAGSFFVIRHTQYNRTDSTSYTLTLPTSAGNFTVPQKGDSLALHGRDSKIFVTDYPVGDATIVYSTAEMFTWQQYHDRTVVVVYSGPDEPNEMLIDAGGGAVKVTGDGVTTSTLNGTQLLVNWATSTQRRILQMGSLQVYIVDRNSAYKYWVVELRGEPSLIVNGGYLVRTAFNLLGSTELTLRADFNESTNMEIIGVPSDVKTLKINNAVVQYTVNSDGNWQADVSYSAPNITLPSLDALDWKYVDSLPEIRPNYNDSAWVKADHTKSNNTYVEPFRTPVSLYGSDYGFHAGALLFRGHFVATGSEKQLYLWTQGGTAFGVSVWLNGTFLDSWPGDSDTASVNSTIYLPSVLSDESYVITVLMDNMGLSENWDIGYDSSKEPRGILDYALRDDNSKNTDTPIVWKITGNLGGEDYADSFRGPLNEGGLFAERQGYHQAHPPVDVLFSSSPFQGLGAPGVAFYGANLTLDLPSDAYDIPLSFTFSKNDTSMAAGNYYRAWLYVNGFQFGRYVSNIGPQADFPVPEGILNYKGVNWIGLAIWATKEGGARVPALELTAKTPVLTGRNKVELVEAPSWKLRPRAY